MIKSSKTLFLIIFLFFIIILIFLLILANRKNIPSQTKSTPQPTSSIFLPTKKEVIPPDIRVAPTIPPQRGGGIDVSSSPVSTSISEINKLEPFLPLKLDRPLATGISVLIVIPTSDLQSNPWTLSVNISDINFQSTPEQNDYELMKNSFKEASSYVFTWITSKGVDPSKIYIKWGDKAYIQDKAEEWLKE